MYGLWWDILSTDGASHMNARATLSNERTVKENGSGVVVIRGMQDNFEVVFRI
jgi:hypothetical protein